MGYLSAEAAVEAASTHGLVTRRALLALPGVTRHVVDGWVKQDVLTGLSRGVYRVAGVPATQRQRLLAAVLRAGPGAAAADESACALHELEGFSLSGRQAVALPPQRRIRPVPFRTVPVELPTSQRTRRHGIPTMTVERALIGVCAGFDERRCRVAVDDAFRRGLSTFERLLRVTLAAEAAPGADRLGRLLQGGTFRHESEGERGLPSLFVDGDPLPEWQVWVLPDVRVDGAYRDARLALEYDSRAWHLQPTDRDADGSRALRLRAERIEVISVTAGMLRDEPGLTRERILTVRRRRLDLGLPPLAPLSA